MIAASAELEETLTGHIDFSAYSRELAIPLDTQNLLDVRLALYSLPNAAVLTAGLAGGEDYRIYIAGRDVTSYVVEELQTSIAAMPAPLFASQYMAGVDAYLNYAKHVHPQLNGSAERAVAADLLAQYSPAQMLAHLGDRSVGWGGNLHPFSFLYRFISLESVSLATTWSAYVQDHPQEAATLASLQPLTVLFSQGPAPSYAPPSNTQTILLGRLVFSLTPIYTNPLEPRLLEMAGRIRTLSKTVDALRMTYLHPMVTDLESVKSEVTAGQAGFQVTLARLEHTVSQIG